MFRKIFGLKAAFLSSAFLMLLLCLPQAQAASSGGVPHTYTSSSYSKVTPVKTPALRTLRNMNLPTIMRTIMGNKNYTQQQTDQLRQKLIASGYIKPPKGPHALPIGKLAPTGVHLPPGVFSMHNVQTAIGKRLSYTSGQAFPGIGVSDSPADYIGCAPPDTNSAVGYDSAIGGDAVIEIVNTCEGPGVGSFKIWNASNGNVIQGTTSLAGFWSSGSGCENGGGDNVALYDQFAQRWLLAQFNNNYTGVCVAISATSDPTGSYSLYDVVMDPNGFNDYPKLAVWVTGDANTDSYFVSANDFPPAACGNCVVYTAIQRSALLTGSAAGTLTVIGPPYTSGLDFSALPANVDGLTMPPLDDPEIFMDYISPWYYGGTTYALELWQMTVDWSAMTASVTGPTAIDVPQFQDGDITCAPQPSPGECLPLLGDRLMFRLAYRNGYTGSSNQVLLTNHTVTANGGSSAPVGIDWYELTAPSGSTNVSDWTIDQQGIYAPSDGNSRWMASLAMDHVGDLGLGYTISGSSMDPSAAYTGQNVGAPAGTMDAAETIFLAGTGVQESTGRWGDYSSIMASATDDCTFWTAQEYISSTGSFNWSTANGSFKFDNCSIGPEGTLAGNVTDSSTGNAIAGAIITLTPGNISSTTDSSGNYSMTVPVATYTAAAQAFGYITQSVPGIGIVQNQTTTQNFALDPAPSATISGNVNDATTNGHTYGLYAEVKVTNPVYGTVADVWSSPTGAYSVTLPQGNDYTLKATPYIPGYDPATATVTNLSGDTTQNLGPTVGAGCAAPGYAFPFGQDFDEGFPPSGWTVTNDYSGSPIAWDTNTNWQDQNYTGGSGVAATADSNNAAFIFGYFGSYDTSLETPEISVSSLGANPVLNFRLNYQEYSGNEAMDVDVSGDGGTTWNTLAHINTNYGGLYSAGGASFSVPITIPSGATQIMLRWRYYNLISGYDWYAQIDNIQVGNCSAIAGGMVYGSVTDQNTGSGLTGATVFDSNTPSNATTTFINSADPNLPQGYYFLFSDTNANDVITASYNNYASSTATLNVSNDSATEQDFALGAPQFSFSAHKFFIHVMINHNVKKTLTISNTGSADGTYSYLTYDNIWPSSPTGQGAPLNQLHCSTRLSPVSLTWLMQNHGKHGGYAPACGNDHPIEGSPSSPAWTAITDFPGGIMDNAVAADEATGLVYSVGGVTGSGTTTAAGYVYDPNAQTWTSIASMASPSEKPAAAFISGKLYVADGWDSSGNPTATLRIYDPSTDTWSTGTDNPDPEGGGVAVAVMNNKMYLIGGCPNAFSCGDTPFESYDPATDTWTQLAPYPHQVSWESCGAVTGTLYCAGGTAGSSEYADGYSYDATNNAWNPIASIPVSNGGLWGSGYMANSSGLLISGGVTNNFITITNEGFVYTPSTDSWAQLPNSINSYYRGGSACGFYKVGGSLGGFQGQPGSELLPGYSPCGSSPIPWLVINPQGNPATVPAGGSNPVTFKFLGAGQQEFTTSYAYVNFGGTPYPAQMIRLKVHWDPMPVDVKLHLQASATKVYAGGMIWIKAKMKNRNLGSGYGGATEVTLHYTLPSGAVLVTTQGPGSCSSSGPAVTCDMPDLPLGSATVEYLFVLYSQSGTFNNTLNVTTREPDVDLANNTRTVSVTVVPVAQVTLNSFTVNQASVPVGGQVTYNLGISNQGNGAAKGVVATMSLPPTMKFTGSSSSACSHSGGLITCNLGRITMGGNTHVSITATAVNAGSANTSATITSTGRDSGKGIHSGSVNLTVRPTSQPPTPRGGK